MSIFLSPFKFKLFLLKNIPLAYIAGLRIISLTADHASIGVRYGYWTKNPFRSLYFAVLAMAAELSTGILAINKVQSSGKNISMLVVGMEATFLKKGTGKVVFECKDGKAFEQIIAEAIKTGAGQAFTATSIGLNEQGEKIAEFKIKWSFKVKS